MSVFYDVKEYLSVKEITEDNNTIFSLAKAHLAWLGWKLLSDCAYVNNISISFGKEKLVFSGDTITADFHHIIRTVKNESSFELTMDYRYFWYGYDGENSCDHLAISSYLKHASPDEARHIFYTMYNNADCSDGAGVLCAYGEKSGKAYNGIIENKVISSFPGSGNWYSPKEAIICCPDIIDGLDMAAIKSIIEELGTLSSNDNITISDDELAYYMNNFEPKNVDDFKKFAYLAGRLIELTNGDCYACAELVDLADPIGRILKIDIKNSKSYTITLAAVDS